MEPSLQKFIGKNFVLHSRVHALNQEIGDATLYIKRDDELSSGIIGSKYRKFASLIPFLTENSFAEVVLIGSAQSNNVAGALQMLNENQIKAKMFLLESNESNLKGNLLWMNMLHDMKDIQWLSRSEWKYADEMARDYQKGQKKLGKKVFVLPEGGFTVEAMPGAMTLAYDIARNEREIGLAFEHIFIDAGSGTTAIGFLLGLYVLQRNCQVHITLIAGTETEFRTRLNEMTRLFEGYTGMKLPAGTMASLHFYSPVAAKSFGSVTKTILGELKSIARAEGILMDPIYSVKHLMTAKQLIKEKALTGNILFVYSGGSFALSGYQEMLGKM